MCTSILSGFKEQSPKEIQWYLCPIIFDLLHLWKNGIMVPTESRPKGMSFILIHSTLGDNYFRLFGMCHSHGSCL